MVKISEREGGQKRLGEEMEEKKKDSRRHGISQRKGTDHPKIVVRKTKRKDAGLFLTSREKKKSRNENYSRPRR